MYLFDAQNRWGYEVRCFTNNQIPECIYSMLRIVGVMSWSLIKFFGKITCIYSMLRIVGVMRKYVVVIRVGNYVYLFDAQNRWGYECNSQIGFITKRNMYLFDAQNRWGYELSFVVKFAGFTLYLFDAQNRWGYEKIRSCHKSW